MISAENLNLKHMLIFSIFETKVRTEIAPPPSCHWDKIWANVFSRTTFTRKKVIHLARKTVYLRDIFKFYIRGVVEAQKQKSSATW